MSSSHPFGSFSATRYSVAGTTRNWQPSRLRLSQTHKPKCARETIIPALTLDERLSFDVALEVAFHTPRFVSLCSRSAESSPMSGAILGFFGSVSWALKESRKTATRWLWWEAAANASPLANFPDKRENTGNFCRNAPHRLHKPVETRRFFGRIPCNRNREFFGANRERRRANSELPLELSNWLTKTRSHEVRLELERVKRSAMSAAQ